MRPGWLTCFLLLAIHLAEVALAQGYLRGQASVWTEVGEEALEESRIGGRYIPEFSWGKPLGEGLAIDAEVAVKLASAGRVEGLDELLEEGRLKPYRLWLRCSGDFFEARLGLQKLNFGPAVLLRPLMWFDRIDPRDPLGLTDGVYGLLGRYYFLNNANLWIWGLYGNDQPRGWDLLPTDGGIELGGRVQYPLGSGEIALTCHRRKADLMGVFSDAILDDLFAGVDPEGLPTERETIVEERFGLDGRWDLKIGLWGEGVVVHQNWKAGSHRYRHFLTVGADYTFALGTGLHLLGEQMLLAGGEELFAAAEDFQFTAMSVGYNLGMLDRLSAILYYDWEGENIYRFLSWGRTYDDWNFYLNGFWNPSTGGGLPGQSERRRGKGLQMLVVFNHGMGI